MQVWIDADACPRAIKQIIFKAASRLHTRTILVSNQPLNIPSSPYLEFVQVPSGPDGADEFILNKLLKKDLVVTADIPFAAQVVKLGGFALTPRGRLYTQENIGPALSVRNFLNELRSGGINTGGPQKLKPKDIQNFANQYDRFLRENVK